MKGVTREQICQIGEGDDSAQKKKRTISLRVFYSVGHRLIGQPLNFLA